MNQNQEMQWQRADWYPDTEAAAYRTGLVVWSEASHAKRHADTYGVPIELLWTTEDLLEARRKGWDDAWATAEKSRVANENHNDELMSQLGDIRELFDVPSVSSPLYHLWDDAMGDPLCVKDWVKANVAEAVYKLHEYIQKYGTEDHATLLVYEAIKVLNVNNVKGGK